MSLKLTDDESVTLDECTFVGLIENNDFEALTAAKTLIERRLAVLRDEKIAYLRQNVLTQTALLGVTPADLFELEGVPVESSAEPPKSAKRDAQSGVPKYKDPNSTANWTGRGKPPIWMKAYLDAGGVKDDLLIECKAAQEENARVLAMDELS